MEPSGPSRWPGEIDLAPGHKKGLVVSNPILLAAGVIGDGDALHRGVDLSHLGAVVVGPVGLRPRAGSPPPRLAEIPGGMILGTGNQNRGVSSLVRRKSRYWPRLGCPVLVHVGETDPDRAARVAELLSRQETVAGIELGLPTGLTEKRLETLVAAVVTGGDLPVLAKVPWDRPEWGPPAVAGGAGGLVVGHGPWGRMAAGAGQPNPWMRGRAYGPQLFPLMLDGLARVLERLPGISVIASGGIHSGEQARQALALGAVALQIDGAAWIEPALPGRLARQLGG